MSVIQRIKELLFSSSPKILLFIPILKEYIDKQAVENCLTESTMNKYTFFYNNICLFLASSKQSLIPVQDIRVKTMEDLRFWLFKHLKACSTEHASRHIELCKRAMKYAVLMEYIPTSPIDPIRAKRDPIKEVISLQVHEIKKLLTSDFASDIYKIVVDLYIFQCFTGLSYMDLWLFEIVQDGKFTWVTCSSGRGKNSKHYKSELKPHAKVILDKYEGKLPRIANQTYNRILKEISHQLGFNKHLTTHTARKTYATLKLESGYSPLAVAFSMGNTVKVLNDHYYKNSDILLKKEIEKHAIEEFKLFG